MSKERRLGRGLEALLGRTARGESLAEPTPTPTPTDSELKERTDSIVAPMIQQAVAMNSGESREEEHMPHLYEAPESHHEMDSMPEADPEPMHDAEASHDSESSHEVESFQETEPSHEAESSYEAESSHDSEPMQEPESSQEIEPTQEARHNSDPDVVMVDVRLIEPNPYQPRRDFDEESLKSLSESIADHGLLQPLVVRRYEESYQLIAGERRFRASQRSGMHEVPVRVVEADDQRMTELAIVENLQRKDLNSLEKANSFKQYMDSHGATQAELAKRLKIDRSTIANMVRLLELPEVVKESLTENRISQGHARALLPLGEEKLQTEFCRRIETESLTVREVERLVKEKISKEDAEPLSVIDADGQKRKPTPTDDQLAALEQQFKMGLGMKVKLTQAAKGRGKLVINFTSHEEFERLRDILLSTQRPQEQAG